MLSRSEILLLVPLTFAGFFIVHRLLSIWQSYSILPILQPQIETLEAIYRSPLPIFVTEKPEAPIVNNFLKRTFNGGNWSEDRVPATNYFMVGHLFATFNTSVIWFISLRDAISRLNNDRRLHGKPRFRIHSSTEVVTAFKTYDTSEHFPFIDRLNEIVNRVRSAGLFEKWQADYNRNGESSDLIYYKRYMRDVEDYKTDDRTDTERFTILIFIAPGWCLSAIVFVIEILWNDSKLKIIFNGSLNYGI